MQQYEKDFLKFHILELVRDLILLSMLISCLFMPLFPGTSTTFTYSVWDYLTLAVTRLQYMKPELFNVFVFLELNWALLLGVLLYVVLAVLLIARLIKAIAAFIDWDMHVINTYDKVSDNPRYGFTSHFIVSKLALALLIAMVAFVTITMIYDANFMETVISKIPEYRAVYYGSLITNYFKNNVMEINLHLIDPIVRIVLIVIANTMMHRVRHSIRLQAVYDRFHRQ